MTYTTQQKRLVAVLGTAVLALVVDQFVFRGTSSNTALPAAQTTPASPSENPGNPTIPAAQNPASSVAAAAADTSALRAKNNRFWGARGIHTRLAELAKARDFPASDNWSGRDPFNIERPADAIPSPTTLPTAPHRDTARDEAEAFAGRHQLRAVIGSGPRGMVLVSDRIIRLGEGLDGWKLTNIAKSSATFEKDALRVRFALSDAPATTGTR